jgi:hypothetical protein
MAIIFLVFLLQAGANMDFKLEPNVGKNDQIFRVIVGVLILAAGWYYQTWLGLIGIIPIIIAYVRFCPLYPMLKMNTLDKKKK